MININCFVWISEDICDDHLPFSSGSCKTDSVQPPCSQKWSILGPPKFFYRVTWFIAFYALFIAWSTRIVRRLHLEWKKLLMCHLWWKKSHNISYLSITLCHSTQRSPVTSSNLMNCLTRQMQQWHRIDVECRTTQMLPYRLKVSFAMAFLWKSRKPKAS